MTARDQERLTGVHPKLIEALDAIFDQMDAENSPMFVVEGVRSDAEQHQLYEQGRTDPGPIVTYKDGVTHRSNHQPHEDGYGYAVDCAFIGPQPFDPRHPWEQYGEAVEAQGLTWGGRWKMADKPHAELSQMMEQG